MVETNQSNNSLGITSFWLKIIAITAMTANHAAYIYADQLSYLAYCALMAVGGLTFPIMLFLLSEGYHYTSDIKKYAIRLLAFAFVAQIPYGLFLNQNPNVLFTLLVCLGLFWIDDNLKNRGIFSLICIIAIFGTFSFDWGFIGPIMALVLKKSDPSKRLLYFSVIPMIGLGLPEIPPVASEYTTTLPYLFYAVVGCGSAGILISKYDGKRGYPLKWFFYLYYPIHILLLGLLHIVCFGA